MRITVQGFHIACGIRYLIDTSRLSRVGAFSTGKLCNLWEKITLSLCYCFLDLLHIYFSLVVDLLLVRRWRRVGCGWRGGGVLSVRRVNGVRSGLRRGAGRRNIDPGPAARSQGYWAPETGSPPSAWPSADLSPPTLDSCPPAGVV